MLVELLQHSSPGVRGDAACALGDRLRTREITGFDADVRHALIKLLDDPVFIVGFEAAIALAEAHEHRATPLLLSALSYRSIRLDAIRALGTMGDESALGPLRILMDKWLLPWADKLQAAAALCALRDATGAQYLKDKLRSNKLAERAAALHFLGESQHPQAAELLSTVLQDKNDPMRDVAIRSIGLLRNAALVPMLEAVLQEATADLEVDIREVIGQLKKL